MIAQVMGRTLEMIWRTVQVEVIVEKIEVLLAGVEGGELILQLDKVVHSVTNWKVGSGVGEAGVVTLAEEGEVHPEVAQGADMEVIEGCVVAVVQNGDSSEFVVSVMECLQSTFGCWNCETVWWIYNITIKALNFCSSCVMTSDLLLRRHCI